MQKAGGTRTGLCRVSCFLQLLRGHLDGDGCGRSAAPSRVVLPQSSGRAVFVDFLIIGATDPPFSLLNKRPNGADELWMPREPG